MFSMPIDSTAPNPYTEALKIAAHGYPVAGHANDGVTREDRDAATCNPDVIRRWHDVGPHMRFVLPTETRFGLVCIKFPSLENVARLEKEFGAGLGKTWVSEREGDSAFYLFSHGVRDPAFDMHTNGVKGTKAKFVLWMPLPGTIYKRKGKIWRWREGCSPDQIELGRLPGEWMRGLPKRGYNNRALLSPPPPGAGITAVITPRYEWSPSPSRDDYE
jgi:hypothetical protein